MTFRDILILLWQQKRIYFGIPFIVGVFFFILLQCQTPQYNSEAIVLLKNTSDTTGVSTYETQDEVSDASVKLIKSKVFLSQLLSTLPREMSFNDLEESFQVEIIEGTPLVIVNVFAETQREADQILGAFAILFREKASESFNSFQVYIIERGKGYVEMDQSQVLLMVLIMAFLWTLCIGMFLKNKIWEKLKQNGDGFYD